jgi:glycerol-3-phosphate acyltransferase PlsY
VLLLVILGGYLLGSVPFAFVLARRRGVDIRLAGSGNVGAANVLRTSGVAVGLIVMALDAFKGAGSVLMAQRWAAGDTTAPAVAGLAAVIGHVYPVWLRFRGGKGVATAAGAFSILTPWAMLPALVVFVTTVWATRFISLGSVAATLTLGPVAYALHAPDAVVIAASASAGIVVFRHRANLARVWRGTERRIGQRVQA